ncbi:Ger(x)C family spore germination protein [Tepidibacter hydrothermalis]|uniref:Ger(X)C family spore germination protein n=1 Tax=Tepidibacter hydrothermalis TaxID=3036126 RepID=A0ABY8EAQ9_9FIRM|nr:Ger(x)C family spore germination protein [Tepidibacter hydrothermalis]WFD08995.1 Ger(x)C family spore germination protein [Tepidibacter hydrothermalis]
MINVKKKILFFIIPISMFILSGCWNYREINDVNIINGAAVDSFEKKDEYVLSVEIIKPQAGQDFKLEADIISEKGKSIFDAVRTMIVHSGKRAYWPHAKVFIISEDIAKKGVVDVIDFINRDAEVRSDIWLLISQEKTAKEILNSETKLHSTISAHLEDKLKNKDSVSKFQDIELHQFLKDLAAEGISCTIPTVHITKEKDQKVPEIFGMGVFKKDKLVGYIDGMETMSMMLIKDELKSGVFVVRNVDNTNTDCTLEIFKTKTKVEPVIKNGNIVMKIDSKLDVGIGEIVGKADLISEPGRDKLKLQAEETVKKELLKTIKRVQKDYDSDIFGFGNVIYRKKPEEWKKIKNDWDQIFAHLNVDVNVEVNIKGSALTSKPIKVGD